MILSQLQPVENIRMPRLQVNGKGALALAPALIHIPVGSSVLVPQHAVSHRPSRCYLYDGTVPGSVVEHPEHGDNAI